MGNILILMLILSFFFAIYFTVMSVFDRIVAISRWYRRRKVDRRIIAQAKATGAWDKLPIVLGGRALELKAWKDFKIEREPDESDNFLRYRYMEEIDIRSKAHTKR